MADKAKVTWKGESDAEDAPQETSLGHLKFKKGEAVEVEDPRIIEKLRGNRFFEVSGGPKTAVPPQPVQPGYQNLAPSQQATQGSVAKAGEPASSPPQPPLPVTPILQGSPLERQHAPAERHGKK
jgi:hypothetical protein